MTFDEILAQVLELLQREKRLSYRALKVRFGLDDDHLEALKDEIIEAKQLAVDDSGKVLVWTGGSATASVQDAPPPPLAPRAAIPAHLADKIRSASSTLAGERKQVTVLFADLKGSTELIGGLDPEAAQQLLDPALHHMMAAVHRFEGTVNQVLGDGIMALFGAPIAHEDHALRACYAALAMQAAMWVYTEEVRRTHGLEMRIRVGLNSGEVVVRAIGNDLHMDYSAVGETTHLAARMEQLATPGSTRLTAATLRLVEGLVQVNSLGPVPVKGLPAPVEVFELVGASTVRRRLQAAVARGLTPFVGRQPELTALQQALAQAAAGHGQVAALVGEAGVGKSRLVYEFVHSHHTQGWRVLESASVSYGKATPYFPVIDLLKRYSHVEEADDARTRRARVTGQVLTLDAALQDTVPALLALLDVLPEDSPFLHLDPPQRRQRTLEALRRVLLRESQVQPLLLVFEDLHWIDTETQALLDNMVESLPTARLLLLVNYRPEYQHGWGSKTYYTQLRLDPLPPASADEFLHALLEDDVGATGQSPLQPLKQLLIERTGGNPFFLEESVRTLVETGVLEGEPGAYRLAQALPTIQVPATVQAILAARIDRLPAEEKHLLQTAAVIGTEVPLPLLQAIAELPDDVLQRGLAHLQAAEFLYETRLFPEREYTFKHALTHEVAYGSLLQERRRLLHVRIVEALEGLAGGRVAEQVERLAHHALRGEVWDKAVAYCRRAGAKAMERSAFREATAALEQALVALQHLPDSRATREQAIDLRFDLRSTLWPFSEHGRILDHLRQAEPLAEALCDQRRLGRLAGYMSVCLRVVGDLDGSLASAQRALAIAAALGDVSQQVAANSFLGELYLWSLSDYRQAAEVCRRNVETLYGTQLRERFGTTTVQSVSSRGLLAVCLAELGAFAEGRVHGEDALQLAEMVDHPYSLAWACAGVGHVFLRQGDLSQAIRVLERGLALSETMNLPLSLTTCKARLGAAYALAGRKPEALPLLEQALELAVTRKSQQYPLFTVWLGEGYVLADRVVDAIPLAQQVLETVRAGKQQGYQAYVLRLLGDIASRCDPPKGETAVAYYRQALTLAEELGMRPLVAHCHLGLGTLYVNLGRPEQARPELTAAIELYHAMDMTFWLPRTEAALAQLQGSGEAR
jgi:class 3 adenylate cyclase/tetratricopeptide (TPR) repeat protein